MAVLPILSGGTGVTLVAFFTLDALFTFFTLDALNTLFALGALLAFLALGAGVTLFALNTLFAPGTDYLAQSGDGSVTVGDHQLAFFIDGSRGNT